MAGRWRRGDLLPIERQTETGDWRWAVPQSVIDTWSAIKLPGEVMRGETNPMSEEGFDRTMNLASMGVSPIRGTTLSRTAAAPVQTTPKTARPKSILSELKTGPTGEPNPVRFGGAEPEAGGFFLGPWATQEQFPGVSLATKPQTLQRALHATHVDEPFDLPKPGVSEYDEALHLTTDPDLAHTYSGGYMFDLYMDVPPNELAGAAKMQGPRVYPLLFNPGKNVANIGELEGALYPWRTGFDEDYGKDPFSSGARQRLQAEGRFNEPYTEAVQSRAAGESFNDFLNRKGISAMRYEHEPTLGGLPYHESFAVTDPKAVINELSPEGILARKYNEVLPLGETNMTREMRADQDLLAIGMSGIDDSEVINRMSRMGYNKDEINAAYKRSVEAAGGVMDESVPQAGASLGSEYDRLNLDDLRADLDEIQADIKATKDPEILDKLYKELSWTGDAITYKEQQALQNAVNKGGNYL